MSEQLFVTFEGPDISGHGVSLDDLQKTLRHVQNAVRHMVRHLAGYNKRGRPPEWLRKESALRLTGTLPGSLVAELSLAESDELDIKDRYGQQAIVRVLEGKDVDIWPEHAANEWFRIGQDLSPEVDSISLEHPLSGQRKEFRREEFRREDYMVAGAPAFRPRSVSVTEAALVYGRLRAVDWVERTAKLVPYRGETVNLRFDADHDRQMLELAMQYVAVRGEGEFDNRDQWIYIQVEEIQGTRSWNEPFELESFLNDPNPKIFDPDKVIRASEPFDVDEFIRVIREGRDVGKEGDSP